MWNYKLYFVTPCHIDCHYSSDLWEVNLEKFKSKKNVFINPDQMDKPELNKL